MDDKQWANVSMFFKKFERIEKTFNPIKNAGSSNNHSGDYISLLKKGGVVSSINMLGINEYFNRKVFRKSWVFHFLLTVVFLANVATSTVFASPAPKSIAGGEAGAVVLMNDGSVVTLGGYGGSNQIPMPTSAASGIISVAAGGLRTAALKNDGSVIVWGVTDFNENNVPVAASSGVKAITIGEAFTAALKTDGSVVVWGNNNFGQLILPASVSSDVMSISAGWGYCLALKSNGSVVAWGDNNNGQSTYGQSMVPDSASSGVIAIAAGGWHGVALKSDSSVVTWGANDAGQSTVPDSAASGVIAIAAGYYHTVALKNDGSVVAWGCSNLSTWPNYGQCTVPESASSGVIAIAAGAYATYALKSDGSLVSFGNNETGQLTISTTPVLGNLSQVYSGTTIPVTVTTTPTGLAVNVTYNGSTTPPTGAGMYAVVATLAGPRYQGSASGVLIVAKKTTIPILGNLSQIYNGTEKSVSVTAPAGLVVNVTYNGSNVAPTAAGSYAVIANIDDPNYQGSASGTLVIAKKSTTPVLSNLSQTYSGTAKSVKVTTIPAGLAVNVTYNGSTTIPKAIGSYAIFASIVDSNYQGSASGILSIHR